MLSRCSGTNRDGGPCSAQALPGRDWCRWHDPELASARDTWRRKGGEARSNKARAKKQLPAEAMGNEEALIWLSIAFRRTLAEQLPPGVLNALATTARTMAQIRESSELDERLAALERAMGLDRRIG